MSQNRSSSRPWGPADFFQNFNAPGALESAITMHRKNVEAMGTAQNTTVEAFKSAVGLNTEYLCRALNGGISHMQQTSQAGGLNDKTVRNLNFLKAQAECAMDHSQDVTTLFAQTAEKVADICAQRLKDSLKSEEEM